MNSIKLVGIITDLECSENFSCKTQAVGWRAIILFPEMKAKELGEFVGKNCEITLSAESQ